MSVGEKLEELINERNRNPFEISKKTGVAVSTIYGYMKRKSKAVNINTLYKLAMELNVDLEYFVDDEVLMPVKE